MYDGSNVGGYSAMSRILGVEIAVAPRSDVTPHSSENPRIFLVDPAGNAWSQWRSTDADSWLSTSPGAPIAGTCGHALYTGRGSSFEAGYPTHSLDAIRMETTCSVAGWNDRRIDLPLRAILPTSTEQDSERSDFFIDNP